MALMGVDVSSLLADSQPKLLAVSGDFQPLG